MSQGHRPAEVATAADTLGEPDPSSWGPATYSSGPGTYACPLCDYLANVDSASGIGVSARPGPSMSSGRPGLSGLWAEEPALSFLRKRGFWVPTTGFESQARFLPAENGGSPSSVTMSSASQAEESQCGHLIDYQQSEYAGPHVRPPHLSVVRTFETTELA